MNRYLALRRASIAIVSILVTGVGGVHAQERPVAFVGISVVPMDEERVLKNHTVVVENGRIVALDREDRIRVPPSALQLDGRGKFLMPGLADMHAHVPGMKQRLFGKLFGSMLHSEGLAEAERMLALMVANGVTTARIMLGDEAYIALRERAANGELLSPRLYVTMSGLNDRGEEQASPEAAIAFVEHAKAAGADFLKMYGISGESFDSAVAASRRVKLPIVGHVPQARGRLEDAIAARYASIEHLDGFHAHLGTSEHAGASRKFVDWFAEPRIDTNKLQRTVAGMKEAGIWNCPTQMIWEIFAFPSVDSLKRWPEMRYVRDTAALFGPGFFAGDEFSPEAAAAARTVVDVRRQIIRALHEAGAGLLLGTDAGASPFMIPGFAVHRELQALVDAGVTPYAALAAATRNAAEFLGTLDSSGTIALGRRADLIVLSANPLDDVSHVRHLVGVMLGGRWLPRPQLDERLAALEGTLD